MRPTELLALVAALLIASVTAAARAESAPTIVVVDHGSEALSRKIRAEALAAGFQIASADPTHEERALIEADAVLALVAVVADDRVEITVRGEPSDVRSLSRRQAEGDAFAVRVVEELRARLVELRLWSPGGAPPPEPLPPEEPPPPIAAPAHPPEPAPPPLAPLDGGVSRDPRGWLWLRGGAAGLGAAGGLGPTLHAVLGLEAAPFDGTWGLSLAAMIPLSESELQEPEGEGEVGISLFVAEVAHHASLSDVWWLAAGLGGGVAVLDLRGETSGPFESSPDTLVAGVYYLHVGLAGRISPWLRLRATLLGGATAPRPVIQFDDREVAAWGRAFGGLVVGADLSVAK